MKNILKEFTNVPNLQRGLKQCLERLKWKVYDFSINSGDNFNMPNTSLQSKILLSIFFGTREQL